MSHSPTYTFNLFDPVAVERTRDLCIHMLTVLPPISATVAEPEPPVMPEFPVPENWLPALDVGANKDNVLAWLKSLKHHPRLADLYWPLTMYMIDHNGTASREMVLWFYPDEVVTGKLHKFTVPFATGWKHATGLKEIPEEHRPVVPLYPNEGMKVRATAFEIQPQIMEVIKTLGGASWEIDLLI